MCFSAQASFGAGAVLAVVGVISIKKSTRPSQLPFAAIPLLFAVQQAAEGALWLGLSGNGHEAWRSTSMYVFLFFAQVVWPLWVPLSIWLLEKDLRRKKILFALLCTGLLASCCLAYSLLFYPVNAQLRNHHIHYALGFPPVTAKLAILYFIPTVITSFVSGYRGVRWMGLLLLVSFIVSKAWFKEELLSVWCFFAAVISVVVLFIMQSLKKLQAKAAG